MLAFAAEHTEASVSRITNECRQRRIPLPDFIQNRPKLLPGEPFYYHAYVDISTARPQSLTDQPIPLPWYEIVRYAQWLGLTGSEEMSFLAIIRSVDVWYTQDGGTGKEDG